MIVVTGASGRVGLQVIAELRHRDLPVRAVSRNPGLLPPAPRRSAATWPIPAHSSRT